MKYETDRKLQWTHQHNPTTKKNGEKTRNRDGMHMTSRHYVFLDP